MVSSPKGSDNCKRELLFSWNSFSKEEPEEDTYSKLLNAETFSNGDYGIGI